MDLSTIEVIFIIIVRAGHDIGYVPAGRMPF